MREIKFRAGNKKLKKMVRVPGFDFDDPYGFRIRRKNNENI